MQHLSFVQQQTMINNSAGHPLTSPTPASPFYSQPPSNNTNPSQGEPKRKRVQVPSACSQCKRAHAACSNTRPCDRCVRINQADACINSHLASMRSYTTKQTEVMMTAPSSFETASNPPPVLGAPNNFNENDVSRFLFDETHDFPEFPEHFESIGACTTPASPANLNFSSSSSSAPSPASSQSTPSPHTCGGHHTPEQQQIYPTQFRLAESHSLPLPSVGPSPAAVAATIAAQFPHGGSVGAGPIIAGVNAAYAADQQSFTPAAQHTMHTAPPPNMMEVMVSELVQQNKKMENIMLALNSEMKSLKQEVMSLKQAGNPMLSITKSDTAVGPATAVWTVSNGLLLEHNQKFTQLLDLIEVPKGYSMQHFFGGPCSRAASDRMQHHLDNIKNSQPVTDYAVIERKRVTGEVMRLMIVVNVVPTATPVFITTMYEL